MTLDAKIVEHLSLLLQWISHGYLWLVILNDLMFLPPAKIPFTLILILASVFKQHPYKLNLEFT